MKNPFIAFIDWYIMKYHAKDYVHLNDIQFEIKRRIENAEERLKNAHAIELQEALETLRIKHHIECDGFKAEIMCMQRHVDDAKKMRKEVEDLRFKVIERARQVVMLTARSKHERLDILEDLSATMGKLDSLVIESEKLQKEIESSTEKEESILRLRG